MCSGAANLFGVGMIGDSEWDWNPFEVVIMPIDHEYETRMPVVS